jgi:CRISPR-associated protein Cas6/Cse3/CasE subtype I-E
MKEILLSCPPGLGAYGLHRLVYDTLSTPGEPRTFIFAPVRLASGQDAVLVRGNLSPLPIPAGQAREIPTYDVGNRFHFSLRANPTVKRGDKPNHHAQIGLSKEKDSLRIRWLKRRSEENGFEVLSHEIRTEPMIVDRPPTAFVLNLALYTGIARVTDRDLFHRALRKNVGRAAAWGCGLLIIQPA